MTTTNYKFKIEDFNTNQITQILVGLQSGLDVSVYAKPDFSWEQMQEIRLRLESGLDVSTYSKPEFDNDQMEEIRLGLEKEEITEILNRAP